MTRVLALFLLLFWILGTQRAPDRDDPPIHAGRRRGAGLRSAEQTLPGDKPLAASRGLLNFRPLLSACPAAVLLHTCEFIVK